MSREQAILENSEAFVGFVRDRLGADLGYDRDGVVWLNDYLDRRRAGLRPEQVDDLVITAGAFLGECLRLAYDGVWAESDGASVVRFPSGAAAFPFRKTRKQLEGGQGDSVLGLFDVIPEFLGPDGVPPNPLLRKNEDSAEEASSA